MTESYLGYSVGDKVYMFDRDEFTEGKVTKVTKTGQVTVEYSTGIAATTTKRYSGYGALIGRSSWSHEYILRKDWQDEQANGMRDSMLRKHRRNSWRAWLDAVRGLDPTDDAGQIITELEGRLQWMKENT